MNTTTMMQLGFCFMVMLVVVHVQAATSSTTSATGGTTSATGGTTSATGGTASAPGGGGGTAVTFTGSGYITLTASVMALLYQLL